VSYTISDGNGGTAIAKLVIDINGVNDAPIGTPLAPAVALEGTPIAIPTAANFVDPDTGDVLKFTATGLPPGLAIDLNTGVISGTPTVGSGGSGPYTVTVYADDGHGGKTPETFVLKVEVPSGNPPIPVPQPLPGPKAPPSGVPVPHRPIITNAVGEFDSLNSAPDFGRDVISDLVEWLGKQGHSASWMAGLFDAMEHTPYAGDTLGLQLSHGGQNVLGARSLVYDSVVFVGIDQMQQGAEVTRIEGLNGALPNYVAHIGRSDIVINVPAGQEYIDVSVRGTAPDGAKLRWNIRVFGQSGEIRPIEVGEKQAALSQNAAQWAMAHLSKNYTKQIFNKKS
jgi:hypothetical protein